MAIYLVMFISCMIISFLAEKSFSNNKKKLGIFFSLLAILIPSIIAGCRSTEVGTDLKVYGVYSFNKAQGYSLTTFISKLEFDSLLYNVINFTIAKTAANFNLFLFVIQLINCTLIYLAIYKKKKIPIWLSYFIYLTTLYFRQLNLLRQGLALSCTIYAFTKLETSSKKEYIYWIIIAALFHPTAFLALPIYYLYEYCKDNSTKSKDNKKIILAITYIVLIISFVFFKKILNLILATGILPEKYTIEYFSRFTRSSIELDNLGTFFKLFWCIVVLLLSCRKKLTKKIKDYNFLMHITLIDFILWNLNIFIVYIDRISFYYGYIYAFFLIPNLGIVFKKDKFNQLIIKIIIIILFLFYWYIRFVYQNAGNVTPYILGI